ncbi:MAG TPA: hypothetical protein VNC84_01620 [Gammaproteobacteria bacterium]|jgi:hypothetical protein|nr:hypothetical protein [Gammaproteobacteria bacterium]
MEYAILYYRHILLFIILFILSSVGYADFDAACLDDCFGTKHDCLYCQYECATDGGRPAVYRDEVTPCLLKGYDNYYH